MPILKNKDKEGRLILPDSKIDYKMISLQLRSFISTPHLIKYGMITDWNWGGPPHTFQNINCNSSGLGAWEEKERQDKIMHPAFGSRCSEDETRLRLALRSPERSSGLWPARRRLRGATLSLSSSCLDGNSWTSKEAWGLPKGSCGCVGGWRTQGSWKKSWKAGRERERFRKEWTVLGLGFI